MKDYIEREQAITVFKTFYGKSLRVVLDALREEHAADVRHVVLCRDCVHFQKVRPHDGFCKMFFKMDGTLLNNDFFCANGKREES